MPLLFFGIAPAMKNSAPLIKPYVPYSEFSLVLSFSGIFRSLIRAVFPNGPTWFIG